MLAGATIAAQAQSADATPDSRFHFGIQGGSVQSHQNDEPVVQLSLGYDIDSIWSVEALVDASLLFERDGGISAGNREFNSAYGARVLATLPLGERWKLVGGLGIVKTDYDYGYTFSSNGFPLDARYSTKQTSPMVSLAAMYKLGRRWSIGLEASSFTKEDTFNLGVRGEFHF